MLDSWYVYLTLYMMMQCWTRDLCIWHYTEWMLDSWSVYLTLYMMTQCWTRDLCIWHYTWWRNVGLVICVSDIIHEWRNVGLVICVSGIIQNDNMLDSWSVHLTLYRMMLDSWSVYLTLYRMTPCWTCDLCIWHYTEWRHVGLMICVSNIIQNFATLDSWSVYMTLYRMKTCRTRDLCIWHYTEWLHVGLVICIWHYTEWWWTCDLYIWHLQNDTTLDSWSVYLTLYRMASCWTSDLYLTLYRMTPCWTRDLCIWHYTWWCNVGLVICVSDILQNDAMLDSWSVYLTLYRMMLDSWSVHLTLYRMMPCWTLDLCIWHNTEWRHVGLVICVSAIIQNDNMLDSWSVYLTLYRMMLDLWSVYLTLYRMEPCWTCDLCIWHYTEWLHVGLVIVYLTLYRMMPCWTNDLFI